jgi:hypothetical protein
MKKEKLLAELKKLKQRPIAEEIETGGFTKDEKQVFLSGVASGAGYAFGLVEIMIEKGDINEPN